MLFPGLRFASSGLQLCLARTTGSAARLRLSIDRRDAILTPVNRRLPVRPFHNVSNPSDIEHTGNARKMPKKKPKHAEATWAFKMGYLLGDIRWTGPHRTSRGYARSKVP
jgi:hypothetical protein